jgi:hypothetical protein
VPQNGGSRLHAWGVVWWMNGVVLWRLVLLPHPKPNIPVFMIRSLRALGNSHEIADYKEWGIACTSTYHCSKVLLLGFLLNMSVSCLFPHSVHFKGESGCSQTITYVINIVQREEKSGVVAAV